MQLGRKGADAESMLDQDTARSDALPNAERLPPPAGMSYQKSADNLRIAKFMKGVEVNPQLASCMQSSKPAVLMAVRGIMFVVPYYKMAFKEGYKIYVQLPHNVLLMVFGAALCFFGGTYVASIAAIEAFRQLGWEKVKSELEILSQQAAHVIAASEEDDKKDEDGDGVADVEQIDVDKFVQRKVLVAMEAIQEPERLQTACGALFASYLAVLATLRLEFARTTAFALGIVEMIKFPLIRYLAPLLAAALGENIKHWTQTIIETGVTFIAVFLAWWLQMIISAFYSGIRGGRMFADGLCAVLVERDLMKMVPLVKSFNPDGSFNPDESIVDEVIGYSIAAVGFLFQLFNGFALKFPLNLVFLPLTIVEWVLRWQISMGSTMPMQG